MQARLRAGVARAEGGDELGRDRAHLRLRGNAQPLGLRAPERRELGVGASEQWISSSQVSRSVCPAPVRRSPRPCCSNSVTSSVDGELLQLKRHGGLGEVQLLGGARDAAQAGDGLEHEKLGQQPMTEESTQLRAGHLGSCSVTEVSLAAACDAAGMTGDVLPY